MQASNNATTELQQLLSSPPPQGFQGNPNNPAAIAHAQLQALRDAGDPSFLFLRVTLELSSLALGQLAGSAQLQPQQEELLFHCITGVRHVLLTKWSTFSTGFTITLKNYCLANPNPKLSTHSNHA